MKKQVKVFQVGCGKMAAFTMRYVYEKGGVIVGGVDLNEEVVGKDIGFVMNTKNMGIKIANAKDLETELKRTKPDVAIVTTMSLMNDLYETLLTCAKCGVNAITTCEEAFYPWNSNEKLTKKLDKVAKENNCTITGSGYQDISWGQLISSLCGTTQTVKVIRGRSSYNVEDYGIALAQVHGAGLPLDRFEKEIASVDNISDEQRQEIIKKGEYSPSYMWTVNGWLCAKLGLTVTRQTQKCVPQTYKKDLVSKTLNMKIPKGYATGMSAVVTTETKEGIKLITECIGKVYGPDECDCNEWTIEGEPNTTMVINRPSTVEMTCASVVNRIPDLISAPAGYVTTDKMGELKYVIKF